MHILQQRFIKINYKFKQNKNRVSPVFVTYEDGAVIRPGQIYII